jgi:5-formyltetrahydrofolate cyclo-ligase
MDPAGEKQAIRRELLAARAARSADDRAACGEAIAGHVLSVWPDAAVVASYLSFGSEPPTGPMHDALRAHGVQVLVPVVTGQQLAWTVDNGSSPPGPLGIPEPTGPRLPARVLDSVDVVIVPALAVDRQGTRLGRGRGYYDRALAEITAAVVAVGYDDELVEELPAEPHDRPVNGMLRPAGLVWLRR